MISRSARNKAASGTVRILLVSARSRPSVGRSRIRPADRFPVDHAVAFGMQHDGLQGLVDRQAGQDEHERAQLIVLEHEMPAIANLIVEQPCAARPAVVEDERDGSSRIGMAGKPRPMREVAVLFADEVAFVEQPDVDRGSAIEQQARTSAPTPMLRGAGPRSRSGRSSHGLMASQMKCRLPSAY